MGLGGGPINAQKQLDTKDGTKEARGRGSGEEKGRWTLIPLRRKNFSNAIEERGPKIQKRDGLLCGEPRVKGVWKKKGGTSEESE